MARPTKVLSPLSDKRINQNLSPEQSTTDPASTPKDPQQSPYRSANSSSDVRARVAQINSLSKDYSPAASSPRSSAALQRAILGREQSDSNVAGLKEQLSEERQEAQRREERMTARMDGLVEELHSTREQQARERATFGEQIKKTKKEAFGADSALLKTQEELKAWKSEATRLNAEIAHERHEMEGLKDQIQREQQEKNGLIQQSNQLSGHVTTIKQEMEVLKGDIQREQQGKNEAIRRSIQLSEQVTTIEQEMEVLKGDIQCEREEKNEEIRQLFQLSEHVTAIEQEMEVLNSDVQRAQQEKLEAIRHATTLEQQMEVLKRREQEEKTSSLRESAEQIQRIAVVEKESADLRAKLQYLESKNDLDLSKQSQSADDNDETLEDLQNMLEWERELRMAAERSIEFMCIECQFKACLCRRAEEEGQEYVYDWEYHTKVKSGGVKRRRFSSDVREGDGKALRRQTKAGEDLLTFSPGTTTLQTHPSPLHSSDHCAEKDLPRPAPRAPSNKGVVDLLTQSPLKIETSFWPSAEVAASDMKADLQSSKNAKVGLLGLSPVKSWDAHSDNSAQHNVHTHDLLLPTPSRSHSAMEFNPRLGLRTMKVPLRDEELPASAAIAPGTPTSREIAREQLRARRGLGRAQGTVRSASAAEGSVRSTAMGVTPARGAKRVPGLHTSGNP